MQLKFVGGAGTVTGSKYLVSDGSIEFLVDCGLFQGLKTLRLKNWDKPPFEVKSLKGVLLTHAHIDHSGYLPLLVKLGFKGKIFASAATYDLCKILLPDAGYLQEEEAEFLNKHRLSKHKPARPLFDQADALKAIRQFEPVDMDNWFSPFSRSLRVRYKNAGHILGSSFLELDKKKFRVTFSGDLGRSHPLIMNPPDVPENPDVLIMESTYGNRLHSWEDPMSKVAEVITATSDNGGVTIIPAFAVGRTQQILYVLYRLRREKRIPEVPIYLNSPMATNITDIFCKYADQHRLTEAECKVVCEIATIIHGPEESKALNEKKGPMVIISASGMASGGRVVHHLKKFLPRQENTVLLTGFQAVGTRGAALLNGSEAIKIHGEYVPVRARVENIDSLSAHADYQEVLDWLGRIKKAPRMTFITHGEPQASESLRIKIQEKLKWRCYVPEMNQQFLLEKLTLQT